MNLSLKSFAQLVEDMGAALQGSATTLVDVSVGSVARAIFEANASVVLWMQWLVLQVLQTTRAATSSGADLDSWMADFGLVRLPAIPSTGVLTFSRYSTTLPSSIPVGATAKSADGSFSFFVTEDATSTLWQPSEKAYLVPAGLGSVSVPAVSNNSGIAGNVLPGMINTVASSIPGIDAVTNAAAFANGMDAESDGQFRARFHGYLASLSRATTSSIKIAISNVRQGLDVEIFENIALNGSPLPGNFLVIVDDGSGEPSSDLLGAIAAAVDGVRPIATTYSVAGPAVTLVNATLTASAVPGVTLTADTLTTIRTTVQNYLNSLPIGKSASITRVAQCAYAATSDVDNISAVQLNGGGSDVPPGPRSVVKAGTVMVTAVGG